MVRVLRRILGMTTSTSDIEYEGSFFEDESEVDSDQYDAMDGPRRLRSSASNSQMDRTPSSSFHPTSPSKTTGRRRIERVTRDESSSFSDSISFSTRRPSNPAAVQPSSTSSPASRARRNRSVYEDLKAVSNIPHERDHDNRSDSYSGSDLLAAAAPSNENINEYIEDPGAFPDTEEELDVNVHSDVQKMADGAISVGDMRRGTASNRSIEATRLYRQGPKSLINP